MNYSTGRPETQAPLSYRRYPVRELRRFPVHDSPRCELLSYELTSAPGMKNPSARRTHGHGSVRLSGGFVVALCVTQDAGEWFLEAAIASYDEARGRRETLDFSLQTLALVYRVVQRHQIAGQARRHMSGAGRN